MRVLDNLLHVVRWLPKIVGAIALLVIIFWMAYGFHSRISPGRIQYERRKLGERKVAVVRPLQTTETISAVGTVQPRRESEIASRLLATIQEITVDPGDHVAPGQLLIALDDREIEAQLREAEAAVAAVSADLDVRERDYRRYEQMFAAKAVTKEDYDRIEGAFQATRARFERAQQQVQRIQVMLTYANIKAPDRGIVSDRFADPGDLAVPGKPLMMVHDPTELELHASVRESLAAHLRPGQRLRVSIDAPHIDTEATVREIAPRAEAASRSVLVKVTLPAPSPSADGEQQLYSGMFGRLQIPIGQRNRVVVAADAVQRIGQLDVVDVITEDNRLERRYVRIGEQIEHDVEVLAGLRIGERVALPVVASPDVSADVSVQEPAITNSIDTAHLIRSL